MFGNNSDFLCMGYAARDAVCECVVVTVSNYATLQALGGQVLADFAMQMAAQGVRRQGGQLRLLEGGRLLAWPEPAVGGSRARWFEQLEATLGRQVGCMEGMHFVLCITIASVLGRLQHALELSHAPPLLHDVPPPMPPPQGARAVAQARLAVDASVRFLRLLGNGQVCLQQQPVVSRGNSARRLYGESLLRWEVAGQRASAAPAIALFEETGFIKVVDQLVIHAVIDQLARDLDLRLACNVSALSLVSDLAWLSVFTRLRSMPGVASRLTLEITESAPVPAAGFALDLLRGLAALGCRIAIDDFGDGFMRMAFCRVLQPSVVKLSSAALRLAASGGAGMEAYGHLAGLARGLAPYVIAEGVECEDDVFRIAQAGITWMQGWAVPRMAADDVVLPLGGELLLPADCVAGQAQEVDACV